MSLETQLPVSKMIGPMYIATTALKFIQRGKFVVEGGEGVSGHAYPDVWWVGNQLQFYCYMHHRVLPTVTIS